MASDNRASFSIIGFTVLAALAAIAATLIYLGGVTDDRDYLFVETYCEKSVSGLSVGSPVNFRGVKLGKVREISFVASAYPEVAGKEIGLVRIVMMLSRKLIAGENEPPAETREDFLGYVKRGLRATVTASGITGLSRIELDMFPDAPPVEPPKWKPKHLYVPSKVSLLDSFSDSATKVMNQINKMDFGQAWSNVSASIESLARATEGVRTTIETRQADFERMMEDASDTAASLKATAAELRRNPSLILRDRRPEALPETE